MVQFAKQLIEAGELGEITHYHGRFLNGYAGDPNGFLSWRFEADQGLGTLGDLASHVIDMAHFLAGPIARLTSGRETFIRERPIPTPGAGTHYDVATGDEAMGPVTNEDYVNALVRFERGAQGILEACRVDERRAVRHVVRGARDPRRAEMEHGDDERAPVPAARPGEPGRDRLHGRC